VGQTSTGAHGLHASPQSFPTQSVNAGQRSATKGEAAMHRPSTSQAFTTAVSTQLRSSGAQSVQDSAQAFPEHGT
jgi:hypothetical protein